jgi:D-amino-acid dehydrogenase
MRTGRRHPHTVIVGGGVIGACCAYYLATRGARVTVLERDGIGKAASYGNAGTIAPGHGPVNKPGRVKQALTSLFDPLSPLYLAPRWEPALIQWLWDFRRTCTERHVRAAMDTLAPLGHATISLFDGLLAAENLDCGYRQAGYHEAFLTKPAFHAAQKEAALMRQYGYNPQSFDGAALRGREPALKRDIVGGVFCPEGATVNPYRFVTELADRAAEYGATFESDVIVSEVITRHNRVAGVRTADGDVREADAVLLATGAYSPGLARGLGLRLPIQAAKGYHRDRTPREGETPRLQRTCMLGESSVFCTPMDGFLRFAGTLEFSGVNHTIRAPRLEQLTNAAKMYLEGVADVPSQSEWCGLRPCTSDGLPVMGQVPGYGGAFVATGHAMLGLTLAPVTGKLMAEYVLDGSPSIDIAALSPDRFAT